jgi:hypothetical protein
MPSLISMCEDSDGCTDWGFKGDQGIALWATGAVANLSITHLDATSISVHREDTRGADVGVKADYTGTISGYWIEGDLAATWPGHWPGVAHTKWHGILFPSQAVTASSSKIYDASLARATAWTVCQDFGDRCSAAEPPVDSLWMLSGKAGTMHLLQDDSAQVFLFVDMLPDNGIVIRRFDKSGMFTGATLLYTGKLEGGTLTGAFKDMWPGHMNAPMSGKWSARSAPTRCAADVSIQTAKTTAILANLHEDKTAALNCYLAAAGKGDSAAESTVGIFYYTGYGAPVDYKKSLDWLEKSADQDNPDALTALSVYFQQGHGAPVNLLLAHYFADRAELHTRQASLFQSVIDGSGKGSTAALNMLGNLAAYFVFGEQDKNNKLAARIGHEESVIGYMNQGMSRVQAEQKVYDDEQMEKLKDDIENGDPCSLDTTSSYAPNPENWQRIYTEREAHTRAYEQCEDKAQASEADFAAAAADYLKCVQTYGDSNAVEQHCKYFQ